MKSPNVIYILVDDLGAGDFSAFNGGLSQTPRLDALIQEGVCLPQHYSASPVCNPSRASLLTGRYPHRTGSIDTLEGRGLDRLALREVTLADAFKRAGYDTGHVGKWHLGAFDPRYHPHRRGFDEFLGFRGGWSDYYRWRLERNGQPFLSDGRYLTDVFTQGAVDFIERHRTAPFFLHVCYTAPHTPPQAPLEDIQQFVEAGRVSFPVAVIYGMIRRLDRGVEQILETLKRTGLEENTLVVFSSDNGPQFVSELGRIDRFNCHLNGNKGTTYEGGVRVPAMVRWPAGGLSGGRTVSELVHMSDWYPTLTALAGLPAWAPNPLDGIDISPILQGQPRAVEPKRFWQWNRYRPTVLSNAAMRDGDWKLVRPQFAAAHQVTPEDLRRDYAMRYTPETVTDIVSDPLPTIEETAPAPLELFNLRIDPQERHNLAAEQPDRVRRMSAELENWFEAVERDRLGTGEARV
jgi:arylsulfatase A-like enzyme